MKVAQLDERGWYGITGFVTPESVNVLSHASKIAKLSLTKIDLVTVKQAERLLSLQSVEHLWLWCDVTRRAMRHIVQVPGLKVLDVLSLRGPGKLESFSRARDLRVLRLNHYLTEPDLLEIARCETLQVLGAQGCSLSFKSLDALLALPVLTSLDVERTPFDDSMAKRVSRSPTLTSLEIGGTRISGKGLGYLTDLQQLRQLDLWATQISEADLQLLKKFPCLEYLSLGNYDGCASFDARQVVRLLLELPSLKRVWLDGIVVSADEKAKLEARFESVQVTSLSDAG